MSFVDGKLRPSPPRVTYYATTAANSTAGAAPPMDTAMPELYTGDVAVWAGRRKTDLLTRHGAMDAHRQQRDHGEGHVARRYRPSTEQSAYAIDDGAVYRYPQTLGVDAKEMAEQTIRAAREDPAHPGFNRAAIPSRSRLNRSGGSSHRAPSPVPHEDELSSTEDSYTDEDGDDRHVAGHAASSSHRKRASGRRSTDTALAMRRTGDRRVSDVSSVRLFQSDLSDNTRERISSRSAVVANARLRTARAVEATRKRSTSPGMRVRDLDQRGNTSPLPTTVTTLSPYGHAGTSPAYGAHDNLKHSRHNLKNRLSDLAAEQRQNERSMEAVRAELDALRGAMTEKTEQRAADQLRVDNVVLVARARLGDVDRKLADNSAKIGPRTAAASPGVLAERIRLLEAQISIMQELVFHSEASYERAAADREELLAQVRAMRAAQRKLAVEGMGLHSSPRSGRAGSGGGDGGGAQESEGAFRKKDKELRELQAKLRETEKFLEQARKRQATAKQEVFTLRTRNNHLASLASAQTPRERDLAYEAHIEHLERVLRKDGGSADGAGGGGDGGGGGEEEVNMYETAKTRQNLNELQQLRARVRTLGIRIEEAEEGITGGSGGGGGGGGVGLDAEEPLFSSRSSGRGADGGGSRATIELMKERSEALETLVAKLDAQLIEFVEGEKEYEPSEIESVAEMSSSMMSFDGHEYEGATGERVGRLENKVEALREERQLRRLQLKKLLRANKMLKKQRGALSDDKARLEAEVARLEEHVNAQWHVIEQSKKALDTETAALHKRHTRIRKELKGLVTAREEDGSPATDREVRLLYDEIGVLESLLRQKDRENKLLGEQNREANLLVSLARAREEAAAAEGGGGDNLDEEEARIKNVALRKRVHTLEKRLVRSEKERKELAARLAGDSDADAAGSERLEAAEAENARLKRRVAELEDALSARSAALDEEDAPAQLAHALALLDRRVEVSDMEMVESMARASRPNATQEEKDAHNAMAQENHLLKAALARLEDLMQATDADAVREARAQARAEAAAAAAAADGTGAGAEGPTRFRPDRPLDHDGGHVQPVLSKRQVSLAFEEKRPVRAFAISSMAGLVIPFMPAVQHVLNPDEQDRHELVNGIAQDEPEYLPKISYYAQKEASPTPPPIRNYDDGRGSRPPRSGSDEFVMEELSDDGGGIGDIPSASDGDLPVRTAPTLPPAAAGNPYHFSDDGDDDGAGLGGNPLLSGGSGGGGVGRGDTMRGGLGLGGYDADDLDDLPPF